MNIEHRTSNIERWMGKDEETEFKKPELLDDILQETEELISACPKSPLFVISTNSAVVAIGYYGEVCREKSWMPILSIE